MRIRIWAGQEPFANARRGPTRLLENGKLRMGAFGATSPLPRVPATVPSRSDLQTFTTVPCKPAVC